MMTEAAEPGSLFRALFRLRLAYEVRDGADRQGFTVTVEDPAGERWPIQLSQRAVDDLALAVEALGAQRREENRASGATWQAAGEANARGIIGRLATGTADPEQLRQSQAAVRDLFERAAARIDQHLDQ